MDTAEKQQHKLALMNICIETINKRIATAVAGMESAQAAANAEEKSSAGDKYETSRAMNQRDKDMFAGQLAANRLELSQLMNTDCAVLYQQVVPGSMVQCDKLAFFIAAGLGRIELNGATIFLLSPRAPLANLLHGKKTGDTIRFNQQELLIREVY